MQVRPPGSTGDGASAQLTTSDFVECYLMHYRRLVRALRLGGADAATAEDIAQEAFARALTRWRRVSRGANPPGYVYTTAFRLLQRALKKAGRTELGLSPSRSVAAVADPDTTLVMAVEALLATMPPKRRACAVMCLVIGLSVHDAGEALGIADGTVRKHLDEARRQLAAQLAD